MCHLFVDVSVNGHKTWQESRNCTTKQWGWIWNLVTVSVHTVACSFQPWTCAQLGHPIVCHLTHISLKRMGSELTHPTRSCIHTWHILMAKRCTSPRITHCPATGLELVLRAVRQMLLHVVHVTHNAALCSYTSRNIDSGDASVILTLVAPHCVCCMQCRQQLFHHVPMGCSEWSRCLTEFLTSPHALQLVWTVPNLCAIWMASAVSARFSSSLFCLFDVFFHLDSGRTCSNSLACYVRAACSWCLH